jgi:hypothetical protein
VPYRLPCQQFYNYYAQIAKKLICQCAMISDEPVVVLVLWLTIHSYSLSLKEVIAVSVVHRKLARKRERRRWPVNDAISLEQSVFSEYHTTKTLKTQ